MFPYVELDMLTFASESQHRRLTEALEILQEYCNRLRDRDAEGTIIIDDDPSSKSSKPLQTRESRLDPAERARRRDARPGPATPDYVHSGFSQSFKDDLEWRSDLLDRPLDFWHAIQGNHPYPLSRRLTDEPGALNISRDIAMERQRFVALAGHPQFRDTLLSVSRLRAFHRDDGESPFL